MMRKPFSIIMVLAMVSSLSSPAFALDATWDGDTSDLWSVDANWSAAHPVAAETATFNALVVAPAGGVNLGAGAACGTLLFDTVNAAAYTIGTTAAGQTLTIANGGSVTVNLGVVQTQTIRAGVVLSPNGAFSNNGANDAFLLNVTGTVTGGAVAGTLTLNGSDTGNNTVSGIISNGAGVLAVTKAELGKWILSGNNTYTGLTTLTLGTLTLSGDNSAASGGVTLTAGTLNINSATALGTGAFTITTGTIDNTSAGDITLTTSGAQTWNGNFAYTGGTRSLNLGTGGVTLGATPTVTVSGNTLTVGGVISGAQGITKAGAGTLTLSGTNTYTGVTTITAGTLRVSNSQALGTGLAANVAHATAGTLDIGSTTLNIGGTYTQAGAATLMVAVNGTAHGSIVAAGAATVPTTASLVLAVSNYVPNNATYTIINGTGGAGVAAPAITTTGDNRATFTATTVGEDLILTASRTANGFASDVTSGDSNASAVGTVLDTVTNQSADMTTVLNTMEGLSNAQVASSLDTLVPEVDAGVINTSTTTLNNFVGVSMDRVEDVLGAAKAADSAATGISAGEAGKLSGIWAKGYGSYLTQGTRNGIAGYDAWNAGTALGADHLFADCVTLGVSGGYAYGDVDSDVNNANTYINSAETTIYGGYEDKNLPYFIDAAGSFAWDWYQGRRDINVGNTILRTANADYDGQQYGAYIGGGYKFDMTKNIEFTPLLSLQYNHLHLQSYTETEAGALNLSVASQDYDQLQSGLGARIAAPTKCKWGTFTPEAHGKWFYDFIGDSMVVGSNFTGGGASFNSNGAKPALNSFNAGGELTFDFKNDVSIIASCDTEMKDEFFGIYGTATLRYDF